MKLSLKLWVKKCFRALGYDLIRLSPASSSSFQQLLALQRFKVDLVFDIGANTGQYASELRAVGYTGTLVSFEPLEVAHAQLVHRASGDRLWHVHKRCAIGDREDDLEINVSGNSVSSSLLPMLESHRSAAVSSTYVGREVVEVSKLDSVAGSFLQPDTRYFIKIDTQGYESAVLDGATEMLRGATGLQLELSLLPLYEGQQLWRELIARLEEEGFTLWALQKGFTDSRDGRTLQVDALFFRVEESV